MYYDGDEAYEYPIAVKEEEEKVRKCDEMEDETRDRHAISVMLACSFQRYSFMSVDDGHRTHLT